MSPTNSVRASAYNDNSQTKPNWFRVGLVAFGVLLVLLFALYMLSARTIKYGSVGVISRFGKLTGGIMEPGLHFVIPFADRVIRIPTVIQSYECSDNPDTSRANYRDYTVSGQTIDGQQIAINYTVIFRVEDPLYALQNIGNLNDIVENVVKAHSRSLSRLYAQSYTAEDLYSGDGIFVFQNTLSTEMIAAVHGTGVVIEDFMIRKINFDPDYIAAIEQQQIAQEAIETAEYQVQAAQYQRDQQITMAEAVAAQERLNADASAYRITAEAEAQAARTEVLAEAEANAIELRGQALRQYPEILQLNMIEALTGNVEYVFLPSDGVQQFLPLPGID